QHVGADLVAPANVRFGRIRRVGFGFALLELGFVEARLQLLHRRGTVLVLRTLVLAGDDDPRRNVGDPDGAIGGVDVLSAGAGRAIGIDPQVLLLDLNVDVLIDLGIDPHAREARVTPGVRVVRADADQAMYPALGLEVPVGVLSLDEDRRRLDARLLAGM